MTDPTIILLLSASVLILAMIIFWRSYQDKNEDPETPSDYGSHPSDRDELPPHQFRPPRHIQRINERLENK